MRHYEKRLRNIICPIIATCVVIVSIFAYRINKYKMSTKEQFYISAIEEYESIQRELRDASDQLWCGKKYKYQHHCNLMRCFLMKDIYHFAIKRINCIQLFDIQ